QDALQKHDQSQDKELGSNVWKQSQVHHPLARIDRPFANYFARRHGSAEPNRNQRQDKISKVARAITTHYQISKKSDDGRLAKKNQQVEFVAAENFQIPASQRTPLTHGIHG